MIFLTVGTMLPFDRLIRAMDNWKIDNPEDDVFAQIGEGKYLPKRMSYKKFMHQKEITDMFGKASIIVSHAGMGTVITALEIGKPIVILPRHAILKEHNNNHQFDTCKWLCDRPGVFVANDTQDLYSVIAEAKKFNKSEFSIIAKKAPTAFTDKIHSAIMR